MMPKIMMAASTRIITLFFIGIYLTLYGEELLLKALRYQDWYQVAANCHGVQR